MGYNTDFYGSFTLNKKLDEDTKNFLRKFSNVRHMKRDLSKTMPMDEAVKYGEDGWKYLDGKGFYGQDMDESIVNYNEPPNGLPGLNCDWTTNDEGDEILWNGCEKSYDMDAWIVFIIDNILKPKGYILNGEVTAQGEEVDDRWAILIKDNEVKIKSGHWSWDE